MDFLSTYSSLNENRVMLGLPHFSFKEYLSALTLRTPQDRLLCAMIAHFLLQKLTTRTSFLNSCNYALQWYENPTTRCKKLPFISNFKDFTDLSLSARNLLFSSLATTVYGDLAEKVQESGTVSSKGADIDTFFELGFDFEGNEWYLLYPDFIVCVGKNLGGCHFNELFDESHEQSEKLLEWMNQTGFFTFITSSSGQNLSITDNLARTQDVFTFIPTDNVFYEELEPDMDGASEDINFSQFHKKFLPAQKLIRLLETNTYTEIIKMMTGEGRTSLIKDIFFEMDTDIVEAKELSDKSVDESFSVADEKENAPEIEEESHADEDDSSEDSEDSYEYEAQVSKSTSVSDKEDSAAPIDPPFSDELKRFRAQQNEKAFKEFCDYERNEEIDTKKLQQTLEKIAFMSETKLSFFEVIEPGLIQFMPFILEKSLEKYDISRNTPISIVKLNGDHRFLNNLINKIEFKAIDAVFEVLNNELPLETFTHSRAQLSLKNYHTHKQVLVNFLDEIYAIGAGFSQYYHDYMHQHNIFMKEFENVYVNFLDDVAPEGEYGQWIIKTIQPCSDKFVLHVYCKPRELTRLAQEFTLVVEQMPKFLENKAVIPRSVELQNLRIFLGYEAPPRPREPTPPPNESSSSSSASESTKNRNERRGYDFSDSEPYTSYNLSSTSTTTPYSDAEPSSDTEYVEYWVYPGNRYTPCHVVRPPFSDVPCVKDPSLGDPRYPFLVRETRSEYNRVLRIRREQRRELIKRGVIPEPARKGRPAYTGPPDSTHFRALEAIREKQRLEMEMYERRLRGNAKFAQIPRPTIDSTKIPQIVPIIPKLQTQNSSTMNVHASSPQESAASVSTQPKAPLDLVVPNLNFNFDLK